MRWVWLAILLVSPLNGCQSVKEPTTNGQTETPRTQAEEKPATSGAPKETPLYTYRVVQTYPHDPKAFTQGLEYYNGFLYESTGLEGQSSLRKVELRTGPPDSPPARRDFRRRYHDIQQPNLSAHLAERSLLCL
jgi:hypothetical protein